jgi:hypothetical protein
MSMFVFFSLDLPFYPESFWGSLPSRWQGVAAKTSVTTVIE